MRDFMRALESASSVRSVDGKTGHESRSRWAWLAIGIVAAIGIARLVRLTRDGAVNVLFGDQWDFLSPLFAGEGPWSLFLQQHGPHRQGLGGLLQFALYRGGDWDVRWEVWCGALIIVGAAFAAVGLAVRVRGRVAWWDAALVLVVLNPLHWETLFLATNIAHSVLPLGVTLLLAHAALARAATMRIVGVSCVGVLCTFTGFALCATVAALAVTLAATSRANRDRLPALYSLGGLAVGVGLFFVGYTWSPAVPGWHFPVAEWWNYGRFGAYMGATLVGLRETTLLATAVGGALLALIVGVWLSSLWQIWFQGATRRTLAAALLTGTSLVYIAFTGFGRLPVGIEAAFMWRYTSLTMTGALGVLIFFQPHAESSVRVWRLVTIGAALAFGLIVWGNLAPDRNIATIAAAKRSWVRAYLETRELGRANAISEFWVYPPQPGAPHIAERLRWLAERKLSFFKKE